MSVPELIHVKTIYNLIFKTFRDIRLRSGEQAEEILMNEMPIIPIYFYSGAYVKHPYVKGVYISKLNHLDLKWASVEIDD